MARHKYFLIGYRTTIGKQGYKFIDSCNCNTLREVKKEFENRNNYKKLLEKYDLIICKGELYLS